MAWSGRIKTYGAYVLRQAAVQAKSTGIVEQRASDNVSHHIFEGIPSFAALPKLSQVLSSILSTLSGLSVVFLPR